ncbi:MAG: hypothetical protein JNK10_09785, partial [Cyclobacteriaceae bacterium]|nr:hypothetical protein [Cyclobacteriaceae bacterium]
MKGKLFRYCLCLSLPILWMGVSPGYAQTGPSTVTAGASEYYTYWTDVYMTSPNWQAVGGTVVSEDHTGFDHSVTVEWGAPGSGSIALYDGTSYQFALLNVTINCPTVSNPSTTFGYTNNCGNTVITRNSGPASGITWYWQTGSSGTSTGSSSDTYEVYSGGTYYVRARSDAFPTCWSSGTASTSSVTINTVPGTVGSPTGATRCGTGTVNLSASTGTNGTGVKWYTASYAGTLLHTGTSYTTSSLSTTTTFYACTYISATGCESSRTAITATISSPTAPATASSTPPELYGSGSATLSATGAGGGETYVWYNVSVGGSPLGSTTQSVSTTSSYYVAKKVTATSCESSRTSVTVPVYTPAVISPSGTRYLAYGSSVSLSTTTYHSYQWFRDDITISGATAQSYLARRPGTYKVEVKGSASAAAHVAGTPVVIEGPTTQTMNMASSTQILREGITESTLLDTLATGETAQMISYQDGLGRTFQTVAVGASPDSLDLISPAGPSFQGLSDTTFLPYVSADRDGRFRVNAIRGSNGTYAASEQYYFYQNESKVAHDTKPFARSIHRRSPDAGVIEQHAPGSNGTNTVRSQLAFNSASDTVRHWKPDGTTSASYAAKTVVVSIVTDENGNQVKTFTNALGQTVLKKVQSGASSWLRTYYIYDEYGRLKYQVPPRAVGLLDSNPNLESDTNLAELIYKYTYDDRGRVIVKKVPGAAEEYIVYDQLDRVVLTQDGNLRASDKWMFVKYDYFNRPVYSGLFSSASSRSTLQTAVDALNYNSVPWYETEASGTYDYTNNAYPTSDTEVLSVNYYDHYDFNRNGTDDYTYDNAHLSGLETSAVPKPRGSPTGSRRLTVNSSGSTTATWLKSVIFYGKYDRVIQTLSNNHLYTTMADKSSVIYDFSGKVIKTKTTHNPSSSDKQEIISRQEYDHVGRVLKKYQTMEHPTEWISKVGVTTVGSTINKTSGADNNWNAGAFSAVGIPASTDGAVKFGVGPVTGRKTMGLSDTDVDITITGMDFAMVLRHDGGIQIYESGTLIGSYGTYTTSDLFMIQRVGTTIYYKKNGSTIYTSGVSSSTALYADCSIFNTDAGFTGVSMVLPVTEKLL